MITLTAPELVRTALGSSNTVGYDKIVLDQVNHSPVNRTVTAQLRLTVSTDPKQPTLIGVVVVDVQALSVTITLNGAIEFTHVTPLTSAQGTAVQGWINTAQQNLETGLASVGALTGTFTSGI